MFTSCIIVWLSVLTIDFYDSELGEIQENIHAITKNWTILYSKFHCCHLTVTKWRLHQKVQSHIINKYCTFKGSLSCDDCLLFKNFLNEKTFGWSH